MSQSRLRQSHASARKSTAKLTVVRRSLACNAVIPILLSAGLALVPILFNEIPVTELAVVHLFSK